MCHKESNEKVRTVWTILYSPDCVASDLPSVAEGGSRRPAERRHRHLAPRLLLLRHRPQHSRPHLALRQVGWMRQKIAMLVQLITSWGYTE